MSLVSKNVPLLPLRDVVVFPHMVVPLFVGRSKSIRALEAASDGDKEILLVAQRNPADEEPDFDGLYQIGTLATILQMLKLPDGTVKVLVEGNTRALIKEVSTDEFHLARVNVLAPEAVRRGGDALLRSLRKQFEQYVKLSKKIPGELLESLADFNDPGRLADTISAHLEFKLEEKQELLECIDVQERVQALMKRIEGEIDILQVEQRIRGRVKKQMEKSQREYYLNEQMKAIQKEMGDLNDSGNELEELEKRIDAAGMPDEARKKAGQELAKLRMMSPMSAEATVVRGYLDWIINVPWKKKSRVKHDIAAAKAVLDEDHFGLDEVKERILEYLAVQSRVKKVKGPVLCLVGPPGVGKTSLGQSIARATNRKYIRMALGGVRDEAEIRGHRRTYIGSLPGKLLQKLAKAEVRNPLFLFDEIDKMGMDHRGDPASALLEVLDPEQNHTFNDHYLEVDFDLSEVMFLCTSNSMNIPPALMDRMEIIRIPGYTEAEKLGIAQRHLIPKQRTHCGLQEAELMFEDEAVRHVIRCYTREAGVRGLEREIAKVCRKVVKKLAEKTVLKSPNILAVADLEEYLGVYRYNFGKMAAKDRVGQVTGLAWTQVGGELLTIECSSVPGKGKVVKTGSLGDVMQESIQAALTVIRSRAQKLGLATDFYEKNDIHVHVPEGATPKDGPSAGIGMCTALLSCLLQLPVKASVAMTGEITLRGEVLPIGGLKEKLLAAHRGGITTAIIPEENVRDLKDIPDNIKNEITIKAVRWIDEVWDIALVGFSEKSAELARPDSSRYRPGGCQVE
jgi:ATP-dependent Lon protease